jgi:hypothetical protein
MFILIRTHPDIYYVRIICLLFCEDWSILYGFLVCYKILNDWYHMYKTLGYISVPIIAYRPKDPVSIGSWREVFTWNQGQEEEKKM